MILMDEHMLPSFQSLNPKLAPERLKALFSAQKIELDQAIQAKHTPGALLGMLDNMANLVEQFFAPYAHMHAVLGGDDYRQCIEETVPLFAEHEMLIHQNQALYDLMSKEDSSLSKIQEKMREDFLKECRLTGIHLSQQGQAEVKRLSESLDKLSLAFQNNLLDSEKAFSHHISDIDELAGVPEHLCLNAQENAKAKGLDGYLFYLNQPTYTGIVTYAKSPALRRLFYEAYQQRAAENNNYDEKKYDNTPLIQEILAKRQAFAKLIGLPDYASYSLSVKMAKEPQRVQGFLSRLKAETIDIAKKDYLLMQNYAKSKGLNNELAPWDLPYYVQLRQRELFAIDHEALRAYFPLPKVMGGVNALLLALYGIHLEKLEQQECWHQDVECYGLYQGTDLIAHLYCDWFSRQDKRGGAWMDSLQTRCRLSNGQIQQAIATLTCNFAKPAPGKVAGLTHDELLTLLHELGHCLHHMLSEVDAFSVSGVHGVEWDAVELPSQWMENWGWVEAWIKQFSGHEETGEPLPQVIFEQLLKMKNDLIGLYLSRQVLFASYDMMIHSQAAPKTSQEVNQAYLDLLHSIASWPVFEEQRFPQSFAHVFAGGYAAGYYSYLWADVLSCDAYEWFAEDLLAMTAKGSHFRQTILSKGGSVPALDAFIAFRGREPDEKALLRSYGL